ncbi:MAG: L-threonylcarbamoyladenylate synthase [candidate division Zixibacteria bacterium]|nr:L-threonylcarbamoyladenylate synthase [candidate division Zixibacteria bacterium]
MNSGTIFTEININNSMADFGKISNHIINGGAAAIPTETVYGLVADASSESAVSIIRALKGKPIDSPIPVFVPTNMPLSKLTTENNEILFILEKYFWPGPLLIVVKPTEQLSDLRIDCGTKIGLRKSSSPFVNQLVDRTGKFLTATSANRYGEEAIIDYETAKAVLSHPKFIIADVPDNHHSSNKPSTAISMEQDFVIILREGVIPVDRIKAILEKEGYRDCVRFKS